MGMEGGMALFSLVFWKISACVRLRSKEGGAPAGLGFLVRRAILHILTAQLGQDGCEGENENDWRIVAR